MATPCKFGHDAGRAANGDCRECHRIRSRKRRQERKDQIRAQKLRYRARHPEKYAEETARWRARNPEKRRIARKNGKSRERAAGGSYSTEDIRRILKQQRGRCAYCRIRLGEFHIDHIVAISRGGSNRPGNLQLTCEACNLRKHARDPISFAQSLGMLL